MEAIAGRAMSYDINKVVHLRTIQQLKSGSAPLFMVTELDPDAPSRQSRSLDTDDMVTHFVFICVHTLPEL